MFARLFELCKELGADSIEAKAIRRISLSSCSPNVDLLKVSVRERFGSYVRVLDQEFSLREIEALGDRADDVMLETVRRKWAEPSWEEIHAS